MSEKGPQQKDLNKLPLFEALLIVGTSVSSTVEGSVIYFRNALKKRGITVGDNEISRTLDYDVSLGFMDRKGIGFNIGYCLTIKGRRRASELSYRPNL